MNPSQVANLVLAVIAGTTLTLFGCASPPRAPTSEPSVKTADPEAQRKLAEFVDITSAFIQRVGQDVKPKGYKVIFTDVGPESLERDAPDVFQTLVEKSSAAGVNVRGFSRAEKDGGGYRDKKTGEKGVGFWMLDIKEDGQGGRIATGSWSEGESTDQWHDVKYRLVRVGTQWRAE